jgi:uncharacterized protein (DUF1697 family)
LATYVALLRGINVGGNNILPMQDFRELLAKLECTDVSTYIQSGNAVFNHSGGATSLSAAISNSIEESFGFRPAVMVLAAKDFSAIAAENPFAKKVAEPKTLHIWFARGRIENADSERIAALAAKDETYHLTETAFYLHAPNGIGRSKLAAGVEKCLGVEGTGRNWRTVGKILEMIAALT